MNGSASILGAVLLPFLGAMFLSRVRQPAWLAVLSLTIATLLATSQNASVEIAWVPDLGLDLLFRNDRLASLFAITIALVGAAVFPYAHAYLGDHPRRASFLATLLAFMGAMLGLVLSDNLLLLFVFWELTSVTSFLLIGFERERQAARRAAIQAFLVTGGGGLALLAGVLLIGRASGTFQTSEIGSLHESPLAGAILGCVLLAAFTKSAQFPFHFWLPNAMQAPTPVSAYLHSATMVQAGVYLLARLSPALGEHPIWQPVLLGVGGATAVLGSVLALLNRDLKRILAYTTVAALGFLVALVGVRASGAFLAFFVAHALYKAAMFLVAGSVDHETGSRDGLSLSGLRRAMPGTFVAAALAGVSMAGVPASLGFVGKELALHQGLVPLSAIAVAFGAGSVAAALAVGLRPFVGSGSVEAHEAPPSMRLGPVVLGIAGILVGLFPAAFLGTLQWRLDTGDMSGDVGLPRGPIPEVGTPLFLTMASWVLGTVLYGLWVRRLGRGFAGLGFDRGYDLVLLGLGRFAGVFSRGLQHGLLNGYIRTIALTWVGLVLLGLTSSFSPHLLRADAPTVYEVGIVLAMLVGAGAALASKSRLAAVAALGIVGYGVALVYVIYGAPDLAMTQIAVETLTLILFIFAVYHLPRRTARRNRSRRVRDAMVAVMVGTLMTLLSLMATNIPNGGVLANYYAENSVPGGKGRNVVNVILVDFRGFDTLGEITVLSVAALGVYALLRLKPGGGDPSAP